MFDKQQAVGQKLNIRVLRTDGVADAAGDTFEPTGIKMPTEVDVFLASSPAGTVGRAVLTRKDDGIYADLFLDQPGLDSMEPVVIGQIISSVEDGEGHRTVTQCEIKGIGLNPESRQSVPQQQATDAPTEQSE